MDAFMQMLLHPIGCLVVGLWILFAAALSWHEAKHIGSFTYMLSRATFVIAGLAFSRAYAWGILTVWIDSGERIHDVRPADVEAVLFQWDASLGWVFLTGAAIALILGVWQCWRREQLRRLFRAFEGSSEEAADAAADVAGDVTEHVIDSLAEDGWSRQLGWYSATRSSSGFFLGDALPSFGGGSSSSSSSSSGDGDGASGWLVLVVVVVAVFALALGFGCAWVLVTVLAGQIRDQMGETTKNPNVRRKIMSGRHRETVSPA